MTKLPKQKILVELDCLLDTRIGTVAMISQDLATKVLNNGYHQRLEDKFEGVDETLFKEMYENRTLSVLEHSTLTTFLPLLKHLCRLIYEEATTRPYHSGPEVIVNIYPYFMTDDLANTFRAAIAHWVGALTPISLTRIEPKNLKPHLCKDFSLMVMYDPTVWFNENLEGLLKTPLRDVALYIPQMYRNKNKTDEELQKDIDEVMHPFAALDFIMRPIISVSQLEVSYFSIFDPKTIVNFDNFHFSSQPEQDFAGR